MNRYLKYTADLYLGIILSIVFFSLVHIIKYPLYLIFPFYLALYFYSTIKNFQSWLHFIRYIWLPVLILIIFGLNIITDFTNTYVIKEFIYGASVLLFFPFYHISDQHKYSNFLNRFLEYYYKIIVIIGFLAFINLIFNYFEIHFAFLFPDTLNNRFNIALIGDKNIYSFYFLCGLLIYFTHPQKERPLQYVELFMIITNILLSFSRRGYALFSLVFMLCLIYIFLFKANNAVIRKAKYFFRICFLFILICLGLFFFREKLVHDNYLQEKITKNIFDFTNILNINTSNAAIHKFLWQTELKNDRINLIGNGDFSEGKKHWTMVEADETNWELISTKFGRSLKITRIKGNGGFSLSYAGNVRILKNSTYEFQFNFKLLKGSTDDFKIGFWVKEWNYYRNALDKTLTDLGDGWYLCTCKYTFKEDHPEFVNMFLNSLNEGTIILISNVKLYCYDCPDENLVTENVVGDKVSMEKNISYRARLIRMKYAFEIWHEKYNPRQKMIGNGFNYMKWYGEKFWQDKSIDYPHNVIISSILYSGMLGGIIYIGFLIMAFIYFFRYFSMHHSFLFMFLAWFIFLMFSGNSHFSVPIFTFLSLVPFLSHYQNHTTTDINA